MDKLTELKLVTEGRFCIGCENVATTFSGDPSAFRCFAPENLESSTLNLVTGRYDKVYKYSNCVLARQSEQACGIEGKWWKKKPDLPIVNNPTKDKPRTGKITADDL